jgi:hypothetical protein
MFTSASNHDSSLRNDSALELIGFEGSEGKSKASGNKKRKRTADDERSSLAVSLFPYF